MTSAQLSLFGLEPAPRDKHLILMIYPDHPAKVAARARGVSYQAENRLGGAVFNPDLMHVTLGHFDYWDEVPQSLIDRISRAATTLGIPPFDVSFDQIGGFPHNVVLRGADGVRALEAFQTTLRRALAWEKLDGAHLAFTPHVTVLYGQPGAVVAPVEPVTWTVREFTLVVSHQGQGRHEVIARYPLAG
ncbi:MAG: 2'-5' RNA ligase family protein [bacterium]|nr:2'-5' RNA ligase family protein [bacterium]